MKSFAPLLIFVVLIYAALVAFLWFRQESLLFLPNMPSREIVATPADIGLRYEALRLPTADGEELDAWFVPAPGERAVLLFFHGNAGNISHRLDSLRIFHELGLSVLIFDYRGYGRSTGRPTEPGTYEDARAAWRHLVEDRGIPAQRIVLFGRSLGGAVATWLAANAAPRALIVESAFRSVPDMAAEIYWFLPVRLLARLHYPVEELLPRVAAPVLVIHSRDDEIIPFAHGEALHAAAGPPTRLLELQGGHNTGFFHSRARYVAGIDAFLREELGL
ncbi:alpha/beta hydrolase [Wenzhouxiangella sp. XN24]|uniref:alpha/beta hydrolase n=1 Tax=Wenzhouxiangella sp. XN24 TaxID=2713569 RepID=UPI0013ECF271|nr:alpha/beta hydrolase [Wenzhouxiangella sp. XN24]NGX15056.1 alpha/beta hydrolase [Wenzhouxiangella sp. XN24]